MRGRRLVDAGRVAWAVIGLVGVLIGAYFVLSYLSVVTVPMVLAFFVAGALQPLARLLRRLRLPPSLAALVALLAGLGVLGGVVALIVPVVEAQVPALVASLQRAAGQVQGLLSALPGPPVDLRSAAARLAGSQTGEAGLPAAVGTTATVLTGVVLVFVVGVEPDGDCVEPDGNWAGLRATAPATPTPRASRQPVASARRAVRGRGRPGDTADGLRRVSRSRAEWTRRRSSRATR